MPKAANRHYYKKGNDRPQAGVVHLPLGGTLGVDKVAGGLPVHVLRI